MIQWAINKTEQEIWHRMSSLMVAPILISYLGTSVILGIGPMTPLPKRGILKVPCLQQVSCMRNIAFCWDSIILWLTAGMNAGI